MPEQNAENLRRVLEVWDPHRDLEAWKHGNSSEVLTLIDPQVAYEDTVLPDHVGETYRGHEGIVRATERWLEPFDDFTVEMDRIIGTGDCLVSVHRFREGPITPASSSTEWSPTPGPSATGRSYT